MPPLNGAFGDFKSVEGSDVLLSQRIGSVTTDYPLWSFSKGEQYKPPPFLKENNTNPLHS